jgi:hypothetical protein
MYEKEYKIKRPLRLILRDLSHQKVTCAKRLSQHFSLLSKAGLLAHGSLSSPPSQRNTLQ